MKVFLLQKAWTLFIKESNQNIKKIISAETGKNNPSLREKKIFELYLGDKFHKL